MPDLILATFAARALVLAGLGWCVYVGLGILAQSLSVPESSELNEDEDRIADEPDPGAEWDRARDRWTDGQLGVA